MFAPAPKPANPELGFCGGVILVDPLAPTVVAFPISLSTVVDDPFFLPVGAGANPPLGIIGLSFGWVTGKYTESVLAVSGMIGISGGLSLLGVLDCEGWESHDAWKAFDDRFETETFLAGGIGRGAGFIVLLLDLTFEPPPNRCVISSPKEFSELSVSVR